MRAGYRVIDSDTHVNPSLDVLLRYADPEFRACVHELAPYRRNVSSGEFVGHLVIDCVVLHDTPPGSTQ